MQQVFVLQHADAETPGTIAEVLADRDVKIRTVRSFAGEPVPAEHGDAAGLIVMGGPMSVYEQDRYPFLRDELRLIQRTQREGKPMLGVCLGSQLLAAAFGAQVIRAEQKEIGWYPVQLSEKAEADLVWKGIVPSFTAFHWHGDVFELANGAESLASSELTPLQAFRYGSNVYGVLFHLEVTESLIKAMISAFPEELQAAGLSGKEIVRDAELHVHNLRQIGRTVFQRWANLLG